MNTFWVKIAAFAVIVVGLIVVVKWLGSGVEQAADFEKTEELMEAQETKLQAELAEAEAKAKDAPAKQQQQQAFVPESDEEKAVINLQAQRLYQMAETEFRIARKPLMSFKRCVDYCRELIRRFPDSPEAAKAKVLLRKMPQRERKKWNVTDEETGL